MDNLRLLPQILAIVAAVIIMAVAVVNIAYAYSITPITYNGKYEWVVAAQVPAVYVPGTPIWNPYAPSNIVGKGKSILPLAYYNPLTAQFYPILAKNWTVQILPNGSAIFTIYLRRGFYWFNGTATIPFTAWDVYAYFYIGMKAFGWYVPWINQALVDEDIRVLNNYTIQFLFQRWSSYIPAWILSSHVATPWPYWKWAVEALKTMNVTQAMAFGQNNITKFVAPYWSLSPWYIIHFSSSSGVWSLVPSNLLQQWYKVFPLADWNLYAPIIVVYWTGGNAQDMTDFMASKANVGAVGLSLPQIGILNKTGILNLRIPVWQYEVILFNPHYYPWDIPQVKLALCYALNKTATAAAWGIPTYVPADDLQMIAPWEISTFPPSLQKYIFSCPYNPAKATQILESLGFYKKNGQWYTPNGTPLSLTIISGSGFTDITTMALDVAEQWTGFGIPTKILGLEVSTFGTELSEGQYVAAAIFPSAGGYYSFGWMFPGYFGWISGSFFPPPKGLSTPYPFAWPNGTCSPVYMPIVHTPVGNIPLPNGTIVWCINSTLGYINFTNWETALYAAYPGTPDYDELIKVIFAWITYYVPGVPENARNLYQQYAYYLIDPNWIYRLPLTTQQTLLYFCVVSGNQWCWNEMLYESLNFGALAPPGVVPPLAQAIANGSLWTKYPQIAAFIGLPTPSPAIQEAVASYFHIPWTPVTTTTTTTTTTTSTVTTVSTVTTTVTSTVTSTVTTTAVSTVTVTKPVISTALIAGIVIIVVVIAIVAALIALRRR